MDPAQRIAQFENMANADPGNEMAHFSLAGAYMQAGRYADAAASYTRCTEINPQMSKAWQLAAESYRKAGDIDTAIGTARKGYEVAASKGDLMPKNALATLLKDLGVPLPRVEPAASAPTASPGGSFACHVSGKSGTQLPRPPFRGPVGRWIYENVSSETWNQWIGQGTKVINELRLDLSRDQDAETYDRHMREFLGIDDDLLTKIRTGT
ncbi:MAG TPA: Fe(2+)-trafficking protein [Phycisphaerales bacterium]|nr:Fe(2+)-trafficking protein [Phycisphaerales bacterium]